ncbi:erg26 [Symbiodinium pilosum]|uniref:Erg26 protein n=1 Tax=Symbiodinium pilosum TaxID=2952 RepID=A0A812S517_SYMPI|nr:erg26 [Symbiodinium pilosum]
MKSQVSLPRSRVKCFVVESKVVIDVEALSATCQSCTKRAWLHAGQYQLVLRGFNPPVIPSILEEELPQHSWRVTLLRRGPSRGPGLNATFSPIAFGSVPNYPLDESESTTGIWRGRTFPQDVDQATSTVVEGDDRLSPTRYISLTT